MNEILKNTNHSEAIHFSELINLILFLFSHSKDIYNTLVNEVHRIVDVSLLHYDVSSEKRN